MPRAKKIPADEIPLEPRKSRRKPAETVAELTETLPIKTAAELMPELPEQVPPQREPRPRPSQRVNGTEHPLEQLKRELEEASTTGQVWERRTMRARPEGPRKRAPGEAGVVYTGPNVLVKMDAETISFDVKRPLTNESRDGVEIYLTTAQQNKLTAAGFDDLSPNGDASAWLAPRNQQALAVVQNLATEFDGKGERLAAGRGR